jgi:hypothetical protein
MKMSLEVLLQTIDNRKVEIAELPPRGEFIHRSWTATEYAAFQHEVETKRQNATQLRG